MTSFTRARRVRLTTVAGLVALFLATAAFPAGAQDISINLGQGGGLTKRVIQLIALLTVKLRQWGANAAVSHRDS